MTNCTACHKAIATIHVLDLQDGQITEQRHLCASCAENAGVVQPKVGPLKLSTEILEDLVSGLKSQRRKRRSKESVACPACGLTADDFRMRGRLGCPRCYDVFKGALVPLLERVHDATSHRGRFPGQAPPREPDNLAELQRKLADAIEAENYEEAASLRDQLRAIESGGGDKS